MAKTFSTAGGGRPPAVQFNMLPIDNTLGKAHQLVDIYKRQISNCLDTCLANGFKAVKNVCDCVHSCMDDTLVKADKAFRKIGKKVQDYLTLMLADAYVRAQQLPCVLPTQAELTTQLTINQPAILNQPISALPNIGTITIGGGNGNSTTCLDYPCPTQFGCNVVDPAIIWQDSVTGCYAAGSVHCPPYNSAGTALLPGTWSKVLVNGVPVAINYQNQEPYASHWYLLNCVQTGGGCDVQLNCPPGQHWDPVNCICVDDTITTCPPGQHWDDTIGGCVDDTITSGGGNDTCCPTPSITINVPPPDLSCLCPSEGNDTLGDWQDWSQDWQAPTLTPPQPRAAVAGGSVSTLRGSPCYAIPDLTIMFRQIGASVLDGNIATGFVLSDLMSVLHALPEEVAKELSDELHKMNAWGMTVFINQAYDETVGAIDICDTESVKDLIACKKLFMFLDSLKVSMHNAAGLAGDFTTGLGVTVPIVEAKIGESNKYASDVGLSIVGDLPIFSLPLVDAVDLCIKYACARELPTVADATVMWLANEIDDDHFDCLVQANGKSVYDFQILATAQRERQNASELVDAWYRGYLDDNQFAESMRGRGWTDPAEIQLQVSLRQELPQVQDLVRFMVRNIYDPDIVSAFNLDAEFDQKFQGQLQLWSQNRAIPLEVMQAHWRAHWVVPSPGQLFEMFQRLRPDKSDVVAAGNVTTIDDVNRALGENDVLPYWRQRFLAIAYRPLTRIDIRRAYILGSIDRAGLISGLKDIGYDATNAEVLAQFVDVQKYQALLKEPEVKAHQKFGIGTEGAMSALQIKGYSQDQIEQALRYAGMLESMETTVECAASLRDRFLSGDLDESDIRGKFSELGLDQDQAGQAISRWTCKRDGKDRAIGASTLCTWYTDQLISQADFVNRLGNLGYSDTNAYGIVAACNAKIAQTQQKKAAALQKQQEIAAAKAAAKQAKELKQEQSAADKLAKQQQAYANYLRRQQDNLVKGLELASVAWGKTKTELAQSVANAITGLESQYGFTVDQANQVLVDSLAHVPKKPTGDFDAWLTDVISSWLELIDATTGG